MVDSDADEDEDDQDEMDKAGEKNELFIESSGFVSCDRDESESFVNLHSVLHTHTFAPTK